MVASGDRAALTPEQLRERNATEAFATWTIARKNDAGAWLVESMRRRALLAVELVQDDRMRAALLEKLGEGRPELGPPSILEGDPWRKRRPLYLRRDDDPQEDLPPEARDPKPIADAREQLMAAQAARRKTG